MLMPKRVKFRKKHRGRRRGRARKGNTVAYGEYGLQALAPCWLTSRQIEAARRAITHHIRRGGKVWIRVFPDKSITAKPAETRMGGGKGNPEFWVASVQPDRMLFELAGVPENAGPRSDAAGRTQAPDCCPLCGRRAGRRGRVRIAWTADGCPGRGRGRRGGSSGGSGCGGCGTGS